MEDFEKAFDEVKPAFGASTETLESYRTHGIIPCGETFDHLRATLTTLVQQVRSGTAWTAHRLRVLDRCVGWVGTRSACDAC